MYISFFLSFAALEKKFPKIWKHLIVQAHGNWVEIVPRTNKFLPRKILKDGERTDGGGGGRVCVRKNFILEKLPNSSETEVMRKIR